MVLDSTEIKTFQNVINRTEDQGGYIERKLS